MPTCVQVCCRVLGIPGSSAAAISVWDRTVNILARGQSGMLVRDTGTYTADSNIKIWNRTTQALETFDCTRTTPQHDFPTPTGALAGSSPDGPDYWPLCWHAAKYLVDNYGLKVNIFCVAWGGTSITEHLSGTDMHNEVVDQMGDAALLIPRIDAVLWHQGESDTGSISTYFDTNMPALLSTTRGFSLGHANLPFIAGELYDGAGAAAARGTFNTALGAYADATSNFAIASSDGLTTIGDNTHFDDASSRTIGEEMGELVHGFASVINAAASGTAPIAASSFTATANGATRVDLAWTDAVDSSIVAYIVDVDSGSGFVENGRVAAAAESYSVTGLTAETEYSFRVRSYSRYGLTSSSTATETTGSASAVDLTTDLLDNWDFDEASGSFVGEHAATVATRNGTVGAVGSGFLGSGAADFDGSTGYANAGTALNADMQSAASMSVYCRFRWATNITTGEEHTLISNFGGGGATVLIRLEPSTNKVEAYVGSSAGTKGGSFSTTISRYTWYNLVLDFDGRYLRLYIDGTLDATVVDAGSIVGMGTGLAPNDLEFGRNPNNSGSEYLDGFIDEASVWVPKLNDASIAAVSAGIAYGDY